MAKQSLTLFENLHIVYDDENTKIIDSFQVQPNLGRQFNVSIHLAVTDPISGEVAKFENMVRLNVRHVEQKSESNEVKSGGSIWGEL